MYQGYQARTNVAAVTKSLCMHACLYGYMYQKPSKIRKCSVYVCMHACMYVWTYACSLRTFAWVNDDRVMYVCVYVCMYVRVPETLRTILHSFSESCMYVLTWNHNHRLMCVCNVCVYTYTYIPDSATIMICTFSEALCYVHRTLRCAVSMAFAYVHKTFDYVKAAPFGCVALTPFDYVHRTLTILLAV